MTGQKLPNIVIIGIDAARADHFGTYGYPKPTSPHIDALANEGLVFDHCFCHINTTDPSFTTMLTGMIPRSHGILKHAEGLNLGVYNFHKHKFVLFQEILKQYGYSTFGIDWLGRWHKRGFDFYLGPKYDRRPPAGKLIDESIARIRTSKKPFFLFIHFWDAHTPYNAPDELYPLFAPEHPEMKMEALLKDIKSRDWKEYILKAGGEVKNAEEIVAKYDAAIRSVDEEIDRLVNVLKDMGIYEDTIILITSDHGESLTEHGIYFDHHGLYETTTHVPLIMVHVPGKGRIDKFVQHADIVPTFLDLLGIPMKGLNIDGMSLVPLIRGETEMTRDFVVFEEVNTQKKCAIRTDEWKYIESPSEQQATCRRCGSVHGGVTELYNLKKDPQELHNVIAEEGETAATLRDSLSSWEKSEKEIVLKRQMQHLKKNLFGK